MRICCFCRFEGGFGVCWILIVHGKGVFRVTDVEDDELIKLGF